MFSTLLWTATRLFDFEIKQRNFWQRKILLPDARPVIERNCASARKTPGENLKNPTSQISKACVDDCAFSSKTFFPRDEDHIQFDQ